MKKNKTLTTIFVTLILLLALVQITTAQTSDEMQTFFSKDYAGISIEVNATQETSPGESMTISLWINCTAAGVDVDYLTLSVYGFKYGREKILLNSTSLIESVSLAFNHTSRYDYTVNVPYDVWGAPLAELYLKYSIIDSPFEYNPSFSISIVRNVYLEELENMFKSLNLTYWQLNQSFWESFNMSLSPENLAQLNKTYWEYQQNYTSLQGTLNELSNTRQAAIALAITTVFFVATTIYLVMRKPKQYW